MRYNIDLDRIKSEINDFKIKMEKCKYYPEIKGILETCFCDIKTVVENDLDIHYLKVRYNNILGEFVSKRLTDENLTDERFVVGTIGFCCSLIRGIIDNSDEFVYNKSIGD